MKSPAEGNGNSNGMGSEGPKTRERRADCPPALVTEAKVVWAALVKTLRTAASDAPTAALYGPADNPFAPLVTLYRYDSSCDVLTLVSALVIGAVYHELKPDYAAEIRRGVPSLYAPTPDCLREGPRTREDYGRHHSTEANAR